MEKITQIDNHIENIRSFSVIGDPGCDGLGVEIMSVFNKALRQAKGDFTMVVGDIVPNGTQLYYDAVKQMVTHAAGRPIYMLSGNHDTNNYEQNFGLKDYFIYDDRLLYIVLDDSKRTFSEETLDVLRTALKGYARDNIVLSFHIPPPNDVWGNSLSVEEWEKVKSIIAPYEDRLKYIICGHVHSYYEAVVDGTALIVTDGGGARIEEVEGVAMPSYHLVEFYYDENSRLAYHVEDISLSVETAKGDASVAQSVQEAFLSECAAHVRYRIYAEHAEIVGHPGLAKLFAAAADSEYYHARNMYFAMGAIKDMPTALCELAANEAHEVNVLYKDNAATASSVGDGLAQYAFLDALEAEKVHMALLNEAAEAITAHPTSDISAAQYWTCTSCGYTFKGDEQPKICPVCGAPMDKIQGVE
jgi:rubrerythrin/predicted phosphodiesterase